MCELSVEMEPRCISVWKEAWTRRSARVTLLVDFDDRFVIVKDPSKDFWFLPGGGVERNESIEEAAKREAVEELGVDVRINRIIGTFHVTLISRETREQLEIHPFVAVHTALVGGQLKTEYAPRRRIVLVKKDECVNLVGDFKVPKEYECMKPYLHVSKEIIRKFLKH